MNEAVIYQGGLKLTIVRGVRIVAASCCGKQYALPRYPSMNFMAFEYWTDGWRVGSLMPNDSGLRVCICGKFILLRDLVEMRFADESDLPRPEKIPAERLPECIEQAGDVEMEVAARVAYWRELNHAYREVYRAHRDQEEITLKSAWTADRRKERSWWKNFVHWPLPEYVRYGNVRITYPPFEPNEQQMANMEALASLLKQKQKLEPSQYRKSLGELYRELGRFDEATQQIDGLPKDEWGVTSLLMKRLISDRERAPVRYRM